MIYQILMGVFGVLGVVALAGASIKRSRRGTFIWALTAAVVAAVSAGYQVFWPVAVFGLMVPWALFSALDVMNNGWRLKAGLTIYLAMAAALAGYPSVHDEMLCDPKAEAKAQPKASCPNAVKALDREQRDAYEREAPLGDRGISAFLTSNVPRRMVRGLDLAGGLRLVYAVDVSEAIRDKRDRYYDDLRSKLTKAYGKEIGFEGEGEPTVLQMQKLDEKVTITKSSTQVGSLKLVFKDPAESQKHINDEFLATFLQELSVLRSADGKQVDFKILSRVETAIRERAVSQARETIGRRVDSMGVKEAAISVRDEDIIVEIPGSDDKQFQEIRDIISQTARLEFKMCDDSVNFFGDFTATPAEELPKGLEFRLENAPTGPGTSQPNYYALLIKMKGETMNEALERMRAWVNANVADKVGKDHEIGFAKYPELDPDTEEFVDVGWRTYYLWDKAEVTGDMVRDAQANPDNSDRGVAGWVVNMDLTPRGGEIFAKVTEQNIKRRFGIILDGKVESTPVIQDRIGGGSVRITMGSANVAQQLADARKLELVLRSGALPAPISPSNEQRIGASLGDDSISQGLTAAGIGGLLVLLLMFALYRRAGAIANIAVVFNLVLQLSILALFDASMTLPGLAGLALTVGMAVDANVLINERIREELDLGKSARAAVALGYEKAFTAIIDGNATTLISGLILAQYGSGPIKGFAVTLIIGMLCNLFTGVVVTRLFFEAWVRGRRRTQLSLG